MPAQRSLTNTGRRVLTLAIPLILSSTLARAEHDTPAASLNSLPSGTSLPVELKHALKAGSARPGDSFTARTTQRIPVAPHTYLPRGVEVSGVVIASEAGNHTPGHPSVLTLRFSLLSYKGQTLPIAATTIAVANFVQVMNTSIIATGAPDRGNPSPAGWTTSQVGGDQVYRSGWKGDVYSTYSHKVGFADFHGIYASPVTPDGLPQALGVFSTNSSGLYGFEDSAQLSPAGFNTTISDPAHTVLLRKGDDLLLKVSPAEAGK